VLNKLRDEAFENAEKHGFHENWDFARALMLTVGELSEAMEADRNGNWCSLAIMLMTPEAADYKNVKGTVEEELADAIIRLLDIAGFYDIDLDWHVKAKMAYNKTRPFKHGKKY